jgi:lysophospholipase L1-like esterase
VKLFLLLFSATVAFAQTTAPALVTVATGNSITRMSQWDADNYWHTNSEIHWANALSGSPMAFSQVSPTARMDGWGIYGYPGQTLPGILADLPAQFFTPLRKASVVPDLVIGNALLENDIAGGSTVSGMQSSLTQWITTMQQKWPSLRILLCTPHLSAYYNTPALVSNYQAMRDYILGLDNNATIFVARIDAYEDPMSPGTPLPGYTDGIHPNAKGALLLARTMAQTLSRLGSTWIQPGSDTSANMTFSGSQPVSGPGVSGTVPTGIHERWGNGTFVATAQNPSFTLQITTPQLTSYPELGAFDMGTLGLHAKQISPFLTVQIMSGAANLRSVELQSRLFYGGSKNTFVYYIQAQSNDVDPDFLDGDTFTFREPPVVAPSGSISAVDIYAQGKMKLAGGTSTVRFVSGGIGVIQ